MNTRTASLSDLIRHMTTTDLRKVFIEVDSDATRYAARRVRIESLRSRWKDAADAAERASQDAVAAARVAEANPNKPALFAAYLKASENARRCDDTACGLYAILEREQMA